MHKVVFVQGGGAGVDQEASVRKLFAAVGAPVAFDTVPAGRAALELGRDPLSDDLLSAVRTAGVARSSLGRCRGGP